MKYKFCGAFFHMTEPEGTTIEMDGTTPFYMLLHFYDPMVIYIDSERVETDRESWVVFRPGTHKRYYAPGGGFMNDYVHFIVLDAPEDGRDPSIFARNNIPLDKVFYLDGCENTNDYFGVITWSLTDVLNDRQLIMEQGLINIFNAIHDCSLKITPRDNRGDNRRLMGNRLNILHDEIMMSPAGWTVEKMARSMYMTRVAFTNLYTTRFGVSPGDDLRRFRLLYAERLLTDTSLPISEISELAGYSNPENFSRFFKSERGITPAAYRKKHLN